MQVSRDTDPFRNILLASNRLQGLGSILVHPQNIPPRCLNCLGSLQSWQWEHPSALGPQHRSLPTQGCWVPCGGDGHGYHGWLSHSKHPSALPGGARQRVPPKAAPRPSLNHKVTSLPPPSARDVPIPPTFPGRRRWWVHPVLCLRVGASTPNHPAVPYGIQPPLVQQAFGVRAAHLQVAFHCHHFSQKKKAIPSCRKLSAAPAALAQPRRFSLRLKAPHWSPGRGGKPGWG